MMPPDQAKPADPGAGGPGELTYPSSPGSVAPELRPAEPGESLPPPAPGLPLPSAIPVEQQREALRGRIAAWLLAILGFIVVGSFVSLWFGWGETAALTDLLTLLFAPMIGLVGAVTGFYYGEKYSSTRP